MFHNPNVSGALAFRGIIVDLLEELKDRMNFTYDLYIEKSGLYGDFTEDVNGFLTDASGLMGEIYNCVRKFYHARIQIIFPLCMFFLFFRGTI